MAKPAARKGDDVAHKKGAGAILDGSANVLINSKPAARQGDPVQHNKGVEPITQGSSTVSFNSKAASRQTDKVGCGGPIAVGSANVLIGDGGAVACSTCPGGVAVGKPVNPLLGAKVLGGTDELDFALPGALSLVWQRHYSSYVGPAGAQAGLLGLGWRLPFEMHLQLWADKTELFDTKNRVITFEALLPGAQEHSVSEGFWLLRGGRTAPVGTPPALPQGLTLDQLHPATRAHYCPQPWQDEPRWAHIPTEWCEDPHYCLAATAERNVWVFACLEPDNAASPWLLVALLDVFGRSQRFERAVTPESRNLRQGLFGSGPAQPGPELPLGQLCAITDGLGRRFGLEYTQLRLGRSDTVPDDTGLRLAAVSVQDPQRAELQRALGGKPLVRYHYSPAGDLIKVEDRHGRIAREFTYAQHRISSHRVLGGPLASYTYQNERLGAKVIWQRNEGGLDYHFDYQAEQTVVTDSLKRTTIYAFKGEGGKQRLSQLTDALGSITTYEHNLYGQLVQETDALGRTTSWRYDGQGQLIGVKGPDGRSSQQAWGPVGSAQDGLVLQSISASGLLTRYDYDTWGRLTLITIAAGTDVASTVQMAYEQELSPAVLPWCDQPIALIDAQGGRKTMSYNSVGQMNSYTDCSGKTSRWRHDVWGELTEEIDALNHRTTYERDLLGRMSQISRPDGSIVQYRWGANDEVQAVTVSGRGTPTLSQGASANTAASTTVTYTHDLWGRVTSKTEAGHKLALRYDVAGRLLELLNENQANTRFAYDAQDRLVQEVGFDGRCQSYAYDAAGQLVGKVDSQYGGMAAANETEQVVRTRYHYDNAGRLVSRIMVKNGEQSAGKEPEQLEVQRFTYDGGGELVGAQSWGANFQGAQQHWLQLCGAKLQTVLSRPQDGSIAQLAQQLQVQRLRARSQVTLQRDKLGRVTGETQVLYRLDAPSGKSANTTDRAQGVSAPIGTGEVPVEFEHRIAHRLGALGQRQGTQLQGLGTLEWLSYGANHVHGVLLNQTPLLHLERDDLHREIGRTLHVLPGDSPEGRPRLNQIEQVCQLDPLGRLLQQRWEGLAVGLQITGPLGAAVGHGTSARQLSQPVVGDMKGHPASVGRLGLRRYSYDGLGQLIGVQTPRDATAYHYDAQQRLVGQTHANSQGSQSQRWRLDPAGNRLPGPNSRGQTDGGRPGQTDWRTQVQQNLSNREFNLLQPDQRSQPTREEALRWPSNRIECCTHTGTAGQVHTVHYCHDAHGDRVQATQQDGHKLVMHYDALHQLTKVETFDPTGRLQSTTAYRYDPFGRRLSKTHQRIDQEQPECSHFGWDGDRQVRTEDTSLICHTVYESDSFAPLLQLQQNKGRQSTVQLLMQRNSLDEDQVGMSFEDLPGSQLELLQGVLSAAMQPGGNASRALPVNAETANLLAESLATLKTAHHASARAHPVTVRHYLTDHLGTPIALVDANGDKAGQVTWAASYSAWGGIQEEYNPHQLHQPIRFQGQQADEETGLHYNRFRYYDPLVGAYVTQDPIGILGGVNAYSYVARPTNGVDPLGLNGREAMQGQIDAIGAQGTGVRLGGAKASLGKVEVKGVHGERPMAGGKQNNAASKASRSVGEVSIGRPCTSGEIAVAPWSRKWFEKKLGIGDESVKGSASVQGPNITVDPVCVDPGQVVNRTAAGAADAVLNNDGLMRAAANPGAALSAREAAAGL